MMSLAVTCLAAALLLAGCGYPASSATQLARTSTPAPPRSVIASTQAATAVPSAAAPVTANPLEQDKQLIRTAIRAVLLDEFYGMKGDTVNYSKENRDEPLIRDLQLYDNGVLSIWFSVYPTGGQYRKDGAPMDISDYNRAEIAVVEVLDSVKGLRLSTTISLVSVASWGPQKSLDCRSIRMDRIAFARTTSSQLESVHLEKWQDLNGPGMFTQMKAAGIPTEIYNPVCR